MTLSIIIAAYNASAFIYQLIASIPKNSDIEILVVNDGSQDTTGEVVSKLSHSNPCIRLFNQENFGVSAARNRGICEAKGKWIMFADADDWFDGRQLMVLVGTLANLDDTVKLATFGVNHVFTSKTIVHRVLEQVLSTQKFLQKGLFMEASWNYAFRKDLIVRYNVRFPEGVINTEDQNFNLKVMAASGKIASFDLVVYNYNKKNEASASNKKHNKAWTKSTIFSALDLVEYCKQHDLSLEIIKGNIAHLLYQFFDDHTSDISLCERRVVYRNAYRKICKAIPSFRTYKKYLIPYYNMTLGMLLFRVHHFIRK